MDTNESPRDLLKELVEKLKLSESESESKIDTNNVPNKSKIKDKSTDISKNKVTIERNNDQTVCSWKLKGNVKVPSICHMGLDRNCKYVKDGCKFLHSKTSYYWQFSRNNSSDWYNFHGYHSGILEKKFRDVTCEEFVLPPLNEKNVNYTIKDLLTILGDKIIKVNFLSMTIDCIGSKQVFSIRHLTTASSAEGNSTHTTTFNWYFKDNADIWQLFGNSDFSSIEIEKAYQQDSSSSVNITNKFQYKVDFPQMTQQNLDTNKVRPIRRRPAPFAAEEDEVSKPIKSKEFLCTPHPDGAFNLGGLGG